MHCALRLEEIYARVVQCLSSDMEKDEKEPLAALAALARTCRAFSDLALDIVWQAPPLLALAQRMDHSVWYMVEEKPEHRPFSLFLKFRDAGFPPLSSLGSRFRTYAKRVRVLSLSSRRRSHINPDVSAEVHASVVEAWIRMDDLFPHLRKLVINEGSYSWPLSDDSLQRLLSCGSLQSLAFSGEYLSPETGAIFTSAAAHLIEFDLDVPHTCCMNEEDIDEWMEFQHAFIANAPQLRVFATNLRLPYKGFMQLAKAPHLQAMHVYHISDLPEDDLCLPPGAFTRMRELCIGDDTESAHLSECILDAIPSGILEVFKLWIWDDQPLTSQMFTALIKRVAKHTSLRNVLLDAHRNNVLELSNDEWISVIGCLQTLSHLETLAVCTRAVASGVFMNSDVIASFTRACPHLETLTFQITGLHASPPTLHVLTLDEFLRLLQTGAHLRSISVCVSTQELPSKTRMDALGPHGYGPVLTIDSAAVTEEFKAAIRSLVPRVKELQVLQTKGASLKIAV